MEEVRKLEDKNYVCLYCGKNIEDTNYECDCPDAIERRRLINLIPLYKYSIENRILYKKD